MAEWVCFLTSSMMAIIYFKFNCFGLENKCRFWDDWIRDPKQRKNRACIRPELPRTRTFGKDGVSGYVLNGIERNRSRRMDLIIFSPEDSFTEPMKPNRKIDS